MSAITAAPANAIRQNLPVDMRSRLPVHWEDRDEWADLLRGAAAEA